MGCLGPASNRVQGQSLWREAREAPGKRYSGGRNRRGWTVLFIRKPAFIYLLSHIQHTVVWGYLVYCV